MTQTRFRSIVGLITAGACLAALVATVSASSHREAPLIAGEPQLDNTDVYAFVSPDRPDTVTLVGSWIPLQEPTGGPTFYPFSDNARYEFNIDNDGDAVADITYRWTFRSSYKNEDTFLYNTGPVSSLSDATLNFTQTYTLERVGNGGNAERLIVDAPVAPSFVGEASMPNYAALSDEAITREGDVVSFAGQTDDPFFLDLRVFDLLYGADLSEVGNDTVNGYNVNTIALQVPKDELARDGDAGANPIVGIWSTTSRPAMRVTSADGTQSFSGDFVQVSRLGNPLVNEVVVPVGAKDLFNGSKPADDAQFLAKVQDPEVPKLIEQIYNMPAPPTPREDLVAVFLTGVEDLNQPAGVTPSEQLRLNMSIPPAGSVNDGNRLGVIGGDNAGFPNGRRLIDDVVDISLQVLEGELVGSPNDLGDGVDANDKAFLASFPYVALPHSGSAVGGGTSSSGGVSSSNAPAAGGGVPTGGVRGGAGGTAGGGSLPLLPVALGVAGVVLVGGAVAGRRMLPLVRR